MTDITEDNKERLFIWLPCSYKEVELFAILINGVENSEDNLSLLVIMNTIKYVSLLLMHLYMHHFVLFDAHLSY